MEAADLLSDTSIIDPAPRRFTLATGLETELVPLKTRQLFRLLKIVTRGAGQALQRGFMGGLDPASPEFVQRLLGLVLMSVPEAEDEAILFAASMCRPVGVEDAPKARLSREQQDQNTALWARLNADLYNPDPGDLVTIIEQTIEQESGNLQELGKRLWALAAPLLSQASSAQEAPDGTELPEMEGVPVSPLLST